MTIKLKKWNATKGLFFLTVLSMQGFAQLIPIGLYIVPGLVKFSDLGVLISALFFLWAFVGVRTKKRTRYLYAPFVLMFIIMIIVSAFMANKFFNQPLGWGIRPLRLQITAFLLYFPMTRMLNVGQMKKKDVLDILFLVGTFELIIYTLQFVLADIAQFTYVNTSEIRYDSARLRVPYLLPMILGLYVLGWFLTGKIKKKKILSLFYVAWCFFLLIGICKHRAPSLILICVVGLGYLLWRKNLSMKAIVGIILGLFAVVFITNSEGIMEALGVLLGGSSTGDTLSIREAGQVYYIAKLQNSPIFGFGFPNIACAAATTAAGELYNYFLVDNGIYGFAYIFGIMGIGWIVLLFVKTLRMSYGLYKKRETYFYLLYFVFELVNLYIGMHWFYYYTFPFVAAFTLLGYDSDRNLRGGCNEDGLCSSSNL